MSDHPFGLRENPFEPGHERRFIHKDPAREEILATLSRGIRTGESFMVLTGEPGTGKSSIIHEAFEGRKSRGSVAILTNPSLTRAELVEEICIRFGVTLTEARSKPELMARLERHLIGVRGQTQGLPAVLVIDEAHLLDVELLEEVRLLANLQAKGRKLLQVVLVGLPALEETLSVPRLEPLRQRIAVHCRLGALDAEQVRSYIHHRLAIAGAGPGCFPEETCLAIHAASHGIAREINTLAAASMAVAQAQRATAVGVEHVRTAAAARSTSPSAPRSKSAGRQADSPTARSAPPAAPDRAPVKREDEEATKTPSNAPAKAPASGPAPGKPRGESSRTSSRPTAREDRHPAPNRTKTPPAAEPVPTRSGDETEVRDWVSRFKGEGPILIGSRANLSTLSLDDADWQTGEGGDDPEFSGTPRPVPVALPRPRTLRSRRRFRWWNQSSVLTAAAAAILVASVALILIPRSRDAKRPPSRSARAAVSESKPKPATTSRSKSSSPQRPASTSTTKSPAGGRLRKPGASEGVSKASTSRTRAVDPAPAPSQAVDRETVAQDPGPTSDPLPSTESSAVTAPRRYALEVASYINEERAREEMGRLSVLTALPTRLRTSTDYSGTTYKILVGRFESRAQAEQAAEDLVGRGILNQARITSIGSRPTP